MRAALEACIEELGAGAEQCDPLLLGQAPHHVTIRVEGGTVVQHDGGTARQRARQPVPHHPAAGSEVEDAVTWPDVAVQLLLHHMLHQQAAGPVDDALGYPGRSR